MCIMNESEPRFVKLYDFFDGNLFSKKDYNLVIPNYQRGYKWAVKDTHDNKAESSVEYLVNTIVESFRTNSELFLQGITVSDSENDKDGKTNVVIIDGQQRLTTLYLLLWVLDKCLIHNTTLKYDARKDTDTCLNKLKALDFDCLESKDFGDTSKQDIYFIKQAIEQISDLISKRVSHTQKSDFINYIKSKIKVIYIPIARKEDAVSTFTMMNGSKAIMRAEELIKSELLRLVSKICQNFSFEATSVEDVLVRLRDFTAMDWNTAETRSRYAREWDKWLYWWNRKEVQAFFRTTSETRPLGLLLDFYYRESDPEHHSYSSFKQFQSKYLQGDSVAQKIFTSLRRLQKRFEDIYNDYFTYNMLSMALSCGDRYEVVSFFLNHLNDNNRDELLKRYTEGRIISMTHKEAELYANHSHYDTSDFQEKKDEFIRSLLAKYVYGNSDENAFRFLSYRNILESNKLKERFNSNIFMDRSLEHIHPKSKVYHLDKKTGKLMKGNGDVETSECSAFPVPMPKGFIKRDDVISVEDNFILSEHSICNLVLLYGRNNSEFGNKDFIEKKEIFFKVTDQKKIFISRTLQHTLSKFAKANWEVKDMIEYYKETKEFLENTFLS